MLDFFGLHFGKIDVQLANELVLKFLFRVALSAFAQGQAADAVMLETAMQRRARQVRNRGLQRVEAIIQHQQGVPPKGHGDGFLRGREHRRSRFGAHARIGCDGALAPFGHRFRIDAVTAS